MKTKTFDCVEMKRKGAEKINDLLSKMTIDEKIEYWKKRSKAFKDEIKELNEKD